MKQLLFFFLCFSVFAQQDNVSVISAERMNIVYRGVPNPIKVAYPGADSLVVSAPGLKKGKGQNNYILYPGAGNDVTVTLLAIMPDGSRKTEKKVFRIIGLSRPVASLYGNDSGSITLTKQELINAEIDISTGNFLFDVDFKIYDFVLIIPGKRQIAVEGNKMNTEAISAIKKLKNGTIINLEQIRFMEHGPLVCFPYLSPVTVEIKN